VRLFFDFICDGFVAGKPPFAHFAQDRHFKVNVAILILIKFTLTLHKNMTRV